MSDVSAEKAVDERAANVADPHDGTAPRPRAPDGAALRTRVRFFGTMVAVWLLALLNGLDIYLIGPAIPAIADGLATTQSLWINNALLCAQVAVAPWSGHMANILGRRMTLAIAVVVAGAGYIASALAHSLAVVRLAPFLTCTRSFIRPQMLLGRVLQGLGLGATFVLGSTIISDLVSLRRRGLYYPLAVGSGFGAASVLGPPIAGLLATEASWRYLFWLQLAVLGCAAALFALCYRVRTPRDHVLAKLAALDWLGNLLFVGSVIALLFPLTQAGVFARWSSAEVLVPLCLAPFGFAAYVRYEATLARPTCPPAIFRNRTSASCYIVVAVQGAVFIGFCNLSAIYFEACRLESATATGLSQLPYGFGEVVGIAVGFAISRTRHYKYFIVAGQPFLLLGLVSLALLRPETAAIGWVGAEVALALGTGPVADGTSFGILASLPEALAANALAFETMLRLLGGALGVSVGGAVLQNRLRASLPAAYLASLPSGPAGPLVAFARLQDIAGLVDAVERQAVREAYADALRGAWLALLGLGVVGAAASLVMRSLPLRDEVSGEHGFADNEVKPDDVEPRA